MVNEACKILDEGIAIRASDIDVVWINGYGWPVYRGGPMHYADSIGRRVIADKLKAYGTLMGADFHISPSLEKS
jgi:3-hydroxyacyl-CoA dehydrogenase